MKKDVTYTRVPLGICLHSLNMYERGISISNRIHKLRQHMMPRCAQWLEDHPGVDLDKVNRQIMRGNYVIPKR